MADVFLKHFSSAKKQHSDDELTAKADAIMAGYMGFRLMCKLGYSTARLQALAKENAKQLTV